MSGVFWLGFVAGIVALVVTCLSLVGTMHLLDRRVARLVEEQSSPVDPRRVVPLQRVGR